ncbi:response regulator [Desulfovibrio ferrophilus]|uniref:histidine kinase n=1 Tax=Desulfovibrio ferrophilus TaxID=241368 RepID=A0A2Z6AXZ2_9BACT|nr:response regulator [Desulfovibrio ferrophilus]BBD08132.1 sensory box protein [Desulfovibrio ferrophilus]
MDARFSLLIATSSEDNAADLTQILGQAGLRPAYTVATTLDDFSRALADEPWDMVLCDEWLGELSWTEAMAMARAERQDVPFLLLTNEADPKAALAAMEAGADDVLIPGDWKTAGTMTRILRQAREHRTLSDRWNKLRSNERTYRGMIDNSVLGIFQCAPWGDLIAFNPSFARILGYESVEQLDQTLQGNRLLPHLDPQAMEALLFMVRSHDRVSDFETMITRPDGSRIWVSISARAIRGEENEISAIEGTFEDIQKRKTVESMIIRAKQEWEKTFDSVPDIILILDQNFRVRRMNMTLAQRLGVHPKDLVGKPCSELFPLQGEENDICDRVKVMSKSGSQAEEMQIPALGGWFLVTVSPFFVDGDTEQPAGSVVVAHDVSNRKDLEIKLRQSQKMEAIGTLAGGIAHDFNNILGVMMGYTEMSLEEAEDGAPAQRRLTEVLSAGRRARDLIHQILTFSRQEELDLQPLDLGSVVKEVVKLLRASLPSSIDIRLDLNDNTGTVRANLSQIHQVLMNLCTNAAHAMRDNGGTLTIKLSHVPAGSALPGQDGNISDAPHARLSVSDQGHGIAADIVDKIFDPFFTTKGPDEGTGMGLAMVHGIVTGHGGVVTVQSVLGEGTHFDILLPVVEDNDQSLLRVPHSVPQQHSGRALFVDDEAPLAAVGGEMLETMGFTVDVETDPKAAWKRFQSAPHDYDLIVTDQTMPGVTGAELAQQILNLRPDIAVIMCTGFSDEMSAERAKKMGLKGYLLKPVLKKDLAASVHEAMKTII